MQDGGGLAVGTLLVRADGDYIDIRDVETGMDLKSHENRVVRVKRRLYRGIQSIYGWEAANNQYLECTTDVRFVTWVQKKLPRVDDNGKAMFETVEVHVKPYELGWTLNNVVIKPCYHIILEEPNTCQLTIGIPFVGARDHGR
jgi:hypothetical protein